MLSMKYELLGCAGMLGAIIVFLSLPGSEGEREMLYSATEATTRSVTRDVFGPQ